MNVRLLFIALLALLPLATRGEGHPRLDLTGVWDFYPDVGDAMLESISAPAKKIRVPGAWQAQGFGEPGGTIPSANIGPGTSPADYLRHNLMARCLYTREVTVPSTWRGRRVILCVRRAYRYTDASVNGRRIGEYEGFCSPFEFDITDAVKFGEPNRLELGVDNRPRPGRDTLGTGNLYGNWGGIGGAVFLEARPAWDVDLFAMPRIAESRVQLRMTLRAREALPTLAIRAEVAPWNSTIRQAPVGEASMTLEAPGTNHVICAILVPVANPRLWTPDDPFLYTARVGLSSAGSMVDEVQVRFGMREITADGAKLILNGKPLYLSGYGDDATEPLTGMLPADKGTYLQRLRLMRSLGFNFVRHHSCVPHDEYFEAADEVGMLVQPEFGLAYTGFWRTGHELFAREWPNVIRAFRNHPSIWAWCMGNELFLNEVPERPGNSQQISRQNVLALVQEAYQTARELDPTRLIHASDGGTPHSFTDVLSSGSPEKARKPFLLHEYGAYCCSLPDFSLIPRLNGVIRPLTYERAERYIGENKLAAVYPRLWESSLMMRADAQKHYIELAKSRGANSGYSFWLGVDFPDSPEGCWDEGVLNQLWEPKPHLTNGLHNLNGSTVLLTTVPTEARSFYAGEGKPVGIKLWHYGAKPIEEARLTWRLLDDGRVLGQGEQTGVTCGLGETRALDAINIAPAAFAAPRFLTLQVELSARDGQRLAENAWQFFAYPKSEARNVQAGIYSEAGPVFGAAELGAGAPFPADLRLLITKGLKRDRHAELVHRGKAAILIAGTGGFKEARAGYFLNQHGTGFGGIIEDHPAFRELPHAGRLHLGLYHLVAGGGLLETEGMPPALRDGVVVWGLRLTGWISPVKNLRKVIHASEVVTDDGLHVFLCNLDLLSGKPECRFVLGQLIDYLAADQVSPLARRCTAEDLDVLLR